LALSPVAEINPDISDHGLLCRQIEPGGGLPMRLPLLTGHLSK
jgi:hypothetical protein